MLTTAGIELHSGSEPVSEPAAKRSQNHFFGPSKCRKLCKLTSRNGAPPRKNLGS
ncbi:hypothetical protein SAMN04488042_108168 [Shimia aestuarii]|uniref:Uncharacterized protein n=1 Tax=Shimia aestuarii TaxID=254406 RepID=A0A1I4RPN8_9RHOB|nr:hypothetical protein SAMN04488042_108168 [Shimia aestuarii]